MGRFSGPFPGKKGVDPQKNGEKNGEGTQKR